MDHPFLKEVLKEAPEKQKNKNKRYSPSPVVLESRKKEKVFKTAGGGEARTPSSVAGTLKDARFRIP
jgi:hypothetical protein